MMRFFFVLFVLVWGMGNVPVAYAKTSDLSSVQVSLYKQIFDVQEKGNWEKADQLIAGLDDQRLMGYVLHQRYMHPTKYRSKYAELKNWLIEYGDHAGAREIYDLAMMRKFSSTPNPPKPRLKRGLIGGQPSFSRSNTRHHSTKRLNAEQKKRAKAIKAAVEKDLKCCGAATRALGRLNTAEAKEVLDTVEIDYLKGKIANTYFYLNRTEKALKTGGEAADRSGVKAPLAAWIAGLAAWRLEDYEASAKYFEISAKSPNPSAWITSASAYWTARAYLRVRQPEQVNKWLKVAAKEPRTFYGMIARKSLGMGFEDLKWNLPSLKKSHIEMIRQHEPGVRATLLLQVGQNVIAEQELMQIHPKGSDAMEEALLAFAAHHKLPALLMRMSTALNNPKGELYDAALYPIGYWQHASVDRALFHGFIRQESRFDSRARNEGSGAAGLMQIIPSTASFISGESFKGKNRYKLLDPELNITLGQKYIRSLLKESYVGGDLFKLAISYNAGPGNMNRWWRQLRHNNDPLFFIESIPVKETRIFVERVMTNFWGYRIRFEQPTPSLDQVMQGKAPIYQSFEGFDLARKAGKD